MKTRVLRTMVGLAAVLGSLLIASPAQATDGPVTARVYTEGISGSGGIARAYVDFIDRNDIIFRNFTVRDVCPDDNLPVRAYATLMAIDGTVRHYFVGSDTNGCGSDDTNFGTFRRSVAFTVAKAGVTICVYTATGYQRCSSTLLDNQYV